MNKVEITEEQGEELQDMCYTDQTMEIGGHTYEFIDQEDNVDDHRWATTNLYVYKRDDGKLFGMLYDIGSTENQENGFVYSTPELYEVIVEQVVMNTYVPAEA